jgi:histidinol-phosphatase
MTADRTDQLLEAVSDVARVAGNVALSHFRSGLAVETKGDGSPVTAADRAAEVAAREWIASRFPDDAIVGEEFGASGDEYRRRCWLIDPIDGTKTFVRGVPLWGTLIAVARGDDVLAGAVFCPAVDEIVVAAVGEGCWWNGARTHVSAVSALSDATLLVTDARFRKHPERAGGWESLAHDASIVRTWGDCYGYLLVATGRAEAMVDNLMAPWDAAALVPVIREAGGEFSDWTGRVTPVGSGAIATNGVLAKTVRSRLGVPWPAPVADRDAPGGGLHA